MPQFSYKARKRSGELVEGVLEVPDRAAALAQIQFWDALIVAAAEQADASRLYSEDLNPGQTIAGVKIVNPLSAP